MEMCKIIHPSKISDESYKVFRELLPVMYRELKGRVVFLQKKERGEISARLGRGGRSNPSQLIGEIQNDRGWVLSATLTL